MEKQWLVAPSLPAELSAAYGSLSPLIAQLLYNRGLTKPAEIQAWLASDNEGQWHDPLAFGQMAEAVALIVDMIKAGKKIAICGDYDADGVTASAVLFETLNTLKAKVDVWIPNRLTEGYGLNKQLLKKIKEAGCELIITVDNGIRSRAETLAAVKLGLQVIVTDHHTAPEDEADWPVGLIINPMLPTEKYPFKYLAGVGVAFKLASALIDEAKLTPNVKERLKNRILDLVAVGTVADCVVLTGENRFLVRQGLLELNRRSRPGLHELAKVSQVNGLINEWNIGWQLAPRLNVAGRLDHANTAYELLVTTDNERAAALALRLNEQNIRRQEETARIVAYCQDYIEANLLKDKILVLSAPAITGEGEAWHEGVVGLVAGKLCERYARPALVVTLSGGKLKGSGRSIENYNIVAALGEVAEHVERYGGHKAACGFTVKDAEHLQALQADLRRIGERDLQETDLQPVLKIDAELSLTDINEKLVEEIGRLAPFGAGNREPLFVARNLLLRDKVTMGLNGQHVKFRFHNFWALAFGEAEKWNEIEAGARLDAVFTLEFNDFNGFRSVQLRLVDMKQSLT